MYKNLTNTKLFRALVLSSVVELAVDCKKGAGLSRINDWKRPTNVTMQREVCLSTRKSCYDFGLK